MTQRGALALKLWVHSGAMITLQMWRLLGVEYPSQRGYEISEIFENLFKGFGRNLPSEICWGFGLLFVRAKFLFIHSFIYLRIYSAKALLLYGYQSS